MLSTMTFVFFFLSLSLISAAPKGPKLLMSPTRAKVGDTVRITVQGFQVGSPGVSAWGVKKSQVQSRIVTGAYVH